jgi:hypothetical protein
MTGNDYEISKPSGAHWSFVHSNILQGADIVCWVQILVRHKADHDTSATQAVPSMQNLSSSEL